MSRNRYKHARIPRFFAFGAMALLYGCAVAFNPTSGLDGSLNEDGDGNGSGGGGGVCPSD